MSFDPIAWNVVIVGRWNPSILTPGGIARRIFLVEKGKELQLQVDVPLDGISPYRVKDPTGNIVVTATDRRLIVEPVQMNYKGLEMAMLAGKRAVENLPETPLSAVGLNINFRTPDLTTPLTEVINSSLDNRLADLQYVIKQRTLTRILSFKNGVINLMITLGETDTQIALNFHRGASEHDGIIEWLSTPKDAIVEQINKLAQALNIQVQEQTDDNNK